MARTKASSNLLNLVESDSEDDLGGFAATVAAATAAVTTKQKKSIRDMPAAKRGRRAAAAAAAVTAPKASKVTKQPAQKKESAVAARKRAAAAAEAVAEETAETAAATTAAKGRPALADRTNELLAEAAVPAAKARGRGRPGRKAAAPAIEDKKEMEVEAEAEAEDEGENGTEPASPEVEEAVVAKGRGRGRPRAGAAVTAAAKGESEDKVAAKAGSRRRAAAGAKKGSTGAATKDDDEDEDESMEEQDEAAGAGDEDGGGDEDKNEDDEENTHQGADITETQLADGMDLDADERNGDDAMRDRTAEAPPPACRAAFHSPVRRSRPAAASSEPAGDAAVRRRLGDLTKKHDSLEARFRDLRDIGVKEAERNFERLKKQGDERVKISDELVNSLKTELATYRDLAKEGARAKREWDACEARAADLQARVDQLTAALSDAKAEARSLTTKLAAARTTAAEGAAASVVAAAAAAGAGGMVPGSAMKKMGGHGGHGGHGSSAADRAAAAAAAAASQVVQLKENLYGDLTGLLVYSARRDGTRELYDCIQTGRSGSLHFKLSIDNDSSSRSSSGGRSDDDGDAQFVYVPQLDASRDADLISRLPDYLVEEISFPRAQAAKFYSRVVQSLMAEK